MLLVPARKIVWLVLAGVTGQMFPLPATAQRVILFEDFESTPPDARPASADFYSRGVVQFADPATDPSKIVVSGGAFADPFDPANQSLVIHNPNSAAQMALTWTSVFDDDPALFRNGSVEFDIWMEKPIPSNFWSFFEVRLGYGGPDRSYVTSVDDVTVWNNFRIQNLFGVPEPVESAVDAGGRYSIGFETVYNDNGDDVMGPDRPFHMRLDISGAPGAEGYTLTMDDTVIVWPSTGEMTHPWVPGAPGINMMGLFSDASAYFSGGANNVYIDNLRVINNDLPPLEDLEGDYNGDEVVNAADYTVWRDTLGQMGSGLIADGNANDEIDAGDYEVWKQHFGETQGSGSGLSRAAVPEPASITLGIFFLIGLVFGLRPCG